eukprot:TRINITY_DN43843_c0_g1_i1.p1 TRINITY_DN43843_c0_g1~~TRINITY_DN43843_c0_g1_i1.p1  ORF type:complete len:568 (-),score=129.95 TRINITY_DN43843_c0_g1_i1:230-1933(-)
MELRQRKKSIDSGRRASQFSGKAGSEASKLEEEEGTGMHFQVFVLVIIVVLLVWMCVTTVVLFLMAVRYLFVTIDGTREWYVVNGCAAWAKAKVAFSLAAAVEVRQAIRTALCRGVIENPEDSAAFERTVMPHLLARRTSLRQVELGFSDRYSVLIVSRRRATDGRWQAMLQSNAADCWLLGLDGCGAVGAPPPPGRPSWFFDTLRLPDEATVWPNEVDLPCPGVLNKSTEEAVEWEAAGELLEQPFDDEGYQQKALAGATAWFPSYRFRFRTGFPLVTSSHLAQRASELLSNTGGSSGTNAGSSATAVGATPMEPVPLIVVGRAVVEFGELNGDTLLDDRLGPGGRVHVCDAAGTLLSSPWPMEVLIVGKPAGKLRFRKVWELTETPGGTSLEAAAWASQLRPAFGGIVPTRLRVAASQWMVAVEPMPPPYERFAVVVVAPTREPFTDLLLFLASIFALIIASLPFLACFCSGCFLVVQQYVSALTETEEDPSEITAEERAQLGVAHVDGKSRRARIFGRGGKPLIHIQQSRLTILLNKINNLHSRLRERCLCCCRRRGDDDEDDE